MVTHILAIKIFINFKRPIFKMKQFSILILILSSFILFGCTENSTYSCIYESRHTGCGGKEWTEWGTECNAFNMDNYKEDWTPEKVCQKYSGTDTNCGGGCCIEIEYRNNQLSKSSCK
jgi:hypothetical protein